MRRAISVSLLVVSMSACDFTPEMCCGYSISRDWSSDVSIVRDGLVVLQDVSAIVESEDYYIVERRSASSTSDRLEFEDCAYVLISKTSGEVLDTPEENAEDLLREANTVVLSTMNSCRVT